MKQYYHQLYNFLFAVPWNGHTNKWCSSTGIYQHVKPQYHDRMHKFLVCFLFLHWRNQNSFSRQTWKKIMRKEKQIWKGTHNNLLLSILSFQDKVLDSHSKSTAKMAFIYILGIFGKTLQPRFSSVEIVLNNLLEIGLFSPGKGTNTFSQCL